MNVAELIESLSKFPSDWPVVFNDIESGATLVENASAKEVYLWQIETSIPVVSVDTW